MAQRETVSISIRFPVALHKRLVEAAAKTGSSLAGEIQRRLTESFEDRSAAQLDRMERQLGVIASALLERELSRSE